MLGVAISLLILGFVSAFLCGVASSNINDGAFTLILALVAIALITGGAFIIHKESSKSANNETINSPEFRIGAVYEKLAEIKLDKEFVVVLKDYGGNIMTYKSPRSLPDKFIATESYELLPISRAAELKVTGVEHEERGGK